MGSGKRRHCIERNPAELEQDGVDKRASVMWLTDGCMYPETEGFIIKTENYVNYIIRDNAMQEDRCRMCRKMGETIQHIISSCKSLVAGEYKQGTTVWQKYGAHSNYKKLEDRNGNKTILGI